MQVETFKKKYGTHGLKLIVSLLKKELETEGELSEDSLELLTDVLEDVGDLCLI